MDRTNARTLDDRLLERVLGQLGMPSVPPITLAGLAEVYDRWCRSVPFDNVRKLIHLRRGDPATLPGDTPADFFEAWLLDGCGGTCWSCNGALHALLSALGFESRRVIATMLVRPGLPPNHGSVTVAVDGTDYIVDAGIHHVEPLPMQENQDSAVDHPAWGVQGVWIEGRFTIRCRNFLNGEWLDCRVERVGATQEEFSSFHEATRTWSPFNFSLSVNSVSANTRLGAAAGNLVAFDELGRYEAIPADLRSRRRFLVEKLGMSERIAEALPEDVPMPPPPRRTTSSP